MPHVSEVRDGVCGGHITNFGNGALVALAAAQSAAVPGPRIATESLRSLLLWLMAFAGGFVLIEPGPYEVVGAATLFIFAATGLTLHRTLAPLVLFLTLLNLGYALSLFEVSAKTNAVTWVLVSVFLSLTAIFFAAMLGANTEARLRWLLRGYIAAAVIVSLLAIGAYFGLLGALSDGSSSTRARPARSRTPTYLPHFWCCPACSFFNACWRDGAPISSAAASCCSS